MLIWDLIWKTWIQQHQPWGLGLQRSSLRRFSGFRRSEFSWFMLVVITLPGVQMRKWKWTHILFIVFHNLYLFFPMETHVSFVFRGYNPYFLWLDTSIFHGFLGPRVSKNDLIVGGVGFAWIVFYVSCFGQDYTLCYVSWEMYQVYFAWPHETQEKNHGWLTYLRECRLTYVGDCSAVYVYIYISWSKSTLEWVTFNHLLTKLPCAFSGPPYQ